MQMLISKASAALGNKELLRIYWYDGIGTTMTAEHKAIIATEDVQFRAGTINGKGQQKGVDSRIVTDLIELASNHAICDAMLITGDGDLAIGIELAQRRGVRVAVMGVEDLAVGVYHSQSPEVTNIADRVIRISNNDIAPYLSYQPAKSKQQPKVVTPPSTGANTPAQQTQNPAPPVGTTPNGKTSPNLSLDAQIERDIESAIAQFLATQNPPLDQKLISSTGSIESQVDRALLFAVMTALGGGRLDNAQKNYARACFRKTLCPPIAQAASPAAHP
jgi:uncharacterized LabA/DUF88 family protein